MNEQTNPDQGVAQDPVDRVAAIFDAQSPDPAPEDTPSQETTSEPEQEAQGQAVELTPDDIPAEEEAPQPAADEFEIVHSGQQHKLTRAETIKLAQQGFDYTQKTQQLAVHKQQVDQQIQRLAQIEQIAPQLQGQLAQVKALEAQLAPYQGVNWVQLAATDPNSYAQTRAQFDMLREAHGQAQQEFQRVSGAVRQEVEQIRQQRAAAEYGRLPDLIPEWKDRSKREAGEQQLAKHFADTYGLRPQDLSASLNGSALALAVAYKAMKYDQLVKSKADKSKTLRQAPPLTVPGAAQSTSAKADKAKQLRQNLKKQGSMDAAVEYLLNR